MNNDKSQVNNNLQFLVDKSSTGRVRPWREKKSNNIILSQVYENIYKNTGDDYFLKRSSRLKGCATYLKFRVVNPDTQILKLKKMNVSCRVRLCPVCAWRRSMKILSHSRKIFTYVENSEQYSNKYDYLFLTLTVKNCKGGVLSQTIDSMMKGFDRLMKRRELKKIVHGWYRGLEITHNHNKYSKSYDTYHPHFHLILCVRRSYLNNNSTDRGYLTKAKWLKIWQECMKDDTITQVDIQEVKSKENSGLVHMLCEVTKYTVKDKSYIISYDWNLTENVVKTLDLSLKNRRLVAWGGILKDIHKMLNLDDEVDGDLININDEENLIANDDKIITELTAFWHVGYNDYVISSVVNKTAEQVAEEERQERLEKNNNLFVKSCKRNKSIRLFDSCNDSYKEFSFEIPENDIDMYNKHIKNKYNKDCISYDENNNDDSQLYLDGLEVYKFDE